MKGNTLLWVGVAALAYYLVTKANGPARDSSTTANENYGAPRTTPDGGSDVQSIAGAVSSVFDFLKVYATPAPGPKVN